MNLTLLVLLPGTLVGVGIAMLISLYSPRLLRVDAALERLGEAPVNGAGSDVPVQRWHRIGAWVAQHLPELRFFQAPTAELDLLGETVSAFYGAKTRNALIGFFLPFIPTVLITLATGKPFAIGLGGSVILAFVFWFLPDTNVRRRARQARQEFTRFVAVYLQLVAGALLGATTVDRALVTSTTLSDSWVFDRIRREFVTAELMSTSKWDALERLGESIGIPVMVNMARTLRLGEARVSLRDQLLAHGEKLRAEVAAIDRDAAHRVTQRIGVPLLCSLIPVLALLVVPVAAQFGTF